MQAEEGEAMTDQDYRSQVPGEKRSVGQLSTELHNKKIDKVQQALLIFFGVIILIAVLGMILSGKVKLW